MRSTKSDIFSNFFVIVFRFYCLFQRQMCKKFNDAEQVAKISRNNAELWGEQYNRYEELDNQAQHADQSSKPAAYVSIMEY